MDKRSKVFLLKTELIAAICGMVLGLGSRLVLVGDTPNSEILPSWLGLMAFLVIAYGLSGLLYGLQHRLWAMVVPHIAILVGGLMWVIPLPI